MGADFVMPRLGLGVRVGGLGSGIRVRGDWRAASGRTGGQNERTWLPSILTSRPHPPPPEWVVEIDRSYLRHYYQRMEMSTRQVKASI